MLRLGLGGRLILFGVLATLPVALLGGWILRGALHQAMRHGFEQRLGEQAELIEARLVPQERPSEGALTYVEPRGGDEFARIFSGWYWRLSGNGTALRSRSLWDAELVVGSENEGGLDAIGPRGEVLFGVMRRVDLAGLPSMTLEVFGPAAPVLDELRTFDRRLVFVLLALLLAVVGMNVIQVRLGLRPLARLRARLGAVERGDDLRIGAGFGPDLDPLATELDDLLDRNARIVARARGHAADLAHALKKPLALLRGESDAAAAVPSPLVREQSATMSRLIDRHLARAGSGAGEHRRILVEPRLASLRDLMQQLHASRHLHWHLEASVGTRWRGEPTDLEEMLGNLLDNAGKWATSHVVIRVWRDKACLHLSIDDDGPGLDEAQLAQAAQRGKRFDETVEGTGLGLAISADIAETYGGSLSLTRSPLGGLRAELILPG